MAKVAVVALTLVVTAASWRRVQGFSYIKASNKTDGFGAQLQAKISCLLEARSHAHSMAYVHLPFMKMEHKNLGASTGELEHLTNLGHGELRPEDLPEDADIEERKQCNDWGDAHPHLYELLRGDLVHKMQSARDVPGNAAQLWSLLKCSGEEVCVAVHIRRGDVRDGDRFLPNEHFIEIMEGLIEGLKYHGLTARFNIFSEGDESDFEDLVLDRHSITRLHLDKSMVESWQSLAAADVLVTTHSSFSYSAGLYNKGLTVYSKFWHSPLPSWIIFHDRTQLVRAVAQQHVGVLLWKRLALRQPAPESI